MAGGFGTTFANDFIKLLFKATAIANVADNAASSPITNVEVSGHTASPSGATQDTSESAYTSYARVAVLRSASGYTDSTNTCALAGTLSFPAGTGGSGTMTHAGFGSAHTSTGKLFFWGTVTPNIVTGNGVTPQFTTAAFLTLAT